MPRFLQYAGTKILFFIIIKPISLLPFPVLYVLSDVLYVALFYIIGYRKKVVLNNLKNSFNHKSDKELKDIAKKFYHHFCDIIVESLKVFSIEKVELTKRFRIINPEVLTGYYNEHKSVILVTGHYGNWEWAAVTLPWHSPHKPMGIYRPLKDKFLNKKLTDSRGKEGLKLVSEKRVPYFFEENKNDLFSYSFIADQTPSNPKAAYWLNFLNQPTAVFAGAEKYAIKYNFPVFYANIQKVKRGYYQISYSPLCVEPLKTQKGEITAMFMKQLEKQIIEVPEYWLWSHRRWKHKQVPLKAV